jgi:PAS domain S-box-containing protein
MIRWNRSPSLQQKIIAAIVFIGLLPLTLSLVLTFLEERRALRETSGANFRELAVEAARRVEIQLTRGINEAQQLATTPFLLEAVADVNRSYAGKDAPAVRAMIHDWQQRWRGRKRHQEFPVFINRMVTNYLLHWHEIRQTDYLAILVTDNQGALVVSSIPQVEYDYGQTGWWQAAFQKGRGQVYVGDLVFEPSFGTHAIYVAVPIYDESRKTALGVVTILLRREALFRGIAEVTIGRTGHAMLLNSEGTSVICPIMPLEEHAPGQRLVASFGAAQTGWVLTGDDLHGGQDSIVGFSAIRLGEGLAKDSLGGKRWIAVVRQDPSETYAPLRQMILMLGAYGGGVLATLVILGTIVARRLVRPVRLLQEGAQKIGKGDLEHQLTIRTGDEIEQLAEAFNSMAANLKRSFDQLQQRMTDVHRLEEQYRDLIENSPEMIHQLNKGGQFVHVNKTEVDRLGYALVDMQAMHVWDIVPLPQAPDVLKFLERLAAHGRATLETIFLARDGTPIDVEMHATALFDPDAGGLVHSRAFVRDITQRKRLEQQVQQYTLHLEQEVGERTRQLAASEQRYRALFDLAADSVFMVSPEGTIVSVNRREEQILGYKAAQVVGRSFPELVPPVHRDALEAVMRTVGSGGALVATREMAVWNGDGATTQVEIDVIRVDEPSGSSLMIQLRDITERKELERRLQQYSEELEQNVRERTREIEETKQYLENLLENANDVIYTLDHDQRFTYVNSKIETWGYQKADLIGRPYLSLLSKRHRGRRLRSTLDIGAKQVYEVEVVSRTGEPRTVMVSVSPLRDREGHILGVLGIARDLTETKRLEQQIRNSERLASVGKLAAGVAHEINNPLGGILNCLYNLRKGTVSQARQDEYVVSMEDGLRRVQKIVRQLLDFSQQREPEPAPTNLNAVLDRVLVLLEHVFTANGIRLDKDFQANLPILFVDGHMMEQVFMNLLLNAIQSIRERGTITLRTYVREDSVVVEVRDTGCGIPSHVLPRIFDPFFTTKTTGEGTGLGLSVSLGIVERHGGHIRVESEMGHGTTFTVTFPLAAVRCEEVNPI